MMMKRNNSEDSVPWGSRESFPYFWPIFVVHDVIFYFSGLIEEYDKEAKKLGEFLRAISDWLRAQSNQNQFESLFS